MVTSYCSSPFLVGRDLVLARDHQAHRARDVGRPHPEVAGPLAVDPHLELGAVEAQEGLDVEQALDLAQAVGQRACDELGRLLEVGPEDVDPHGEEHLAAAQGEGMTTL